MFLKLNYFYYFTHTNICEQSGLRKFYVKFIGDILHEHDSWPPAPEIEPLNNQNSFWKNPTKFFLTQPLL